MSSRAAWRLESLGFTSVYRYEAGKADWLANGWPIEGEQADQPTAGTLAHRDVPTCSLNEQLDAIRPRLAATEYESCPVVNEQNIVLGLLRRAAWSEDLSKTAQEVMDCAPRTYRLDAQPDAMLKYMDRHAVDSVLVTTSDGELVGLVLRADVTAALGRQNHTD
jgi:predicted transcriptional regulator